MEDRSMTEILAGIDHLLDDLYEIPRAALATYHRTPAEMRIEHTAAAAAHNVWCHMQAEAERRFDGRPKLVLKDIRGMRVWMVEDIAVLRLKKMDENGRSRNYQTPQQKKYDREATLPGLPPEAARLTAGYLLDPTGTTIDYTMVARVSGSYLPRWCVSVNDSTAPERYDVIVKELHGK